MLRLTWVFGLVCLFGSVASAVIIYAPVQYQYRDPMNNAPAFYYGGNDPLVFEAAARRQQRYDLGPNAATVGSDFNPVGRFGYNLIPSTIINNPASVTYTDLLPAGINAYPYGYSVTDARNDAYAGVPLYFRKKDLLASAYPLEDGNAVVPAQAPLPGTIEIKPYRPPTTRPATRSTTEPILIIPRRLLDKPLRSNLPLVARAR